MSNALFGSPTWGDLATWTVTSNLPEPGMGEVRLTTDQPRDRFQSQAAAEIIMDGVLTGGGLVNAISLLYTNATPPGTTGVTEAKWSLFAVAPGDPIGSGPYLINEANLTFAAVGTPTGDSIDRWDRIHGLYILPSPVNIETLRIHLADAQNPEGFQTIGRLVVGNLWQPTINMQYGSDLFGWQDEVSPRIDPSSGVTFLNRSSPNPIMNFSLISESRSELLDNAYNIARQRGSSRSTFFVRDPADVSYLAQGISYGVLQQLQSAVESSYSFYRLRYQIKGLT